MILIEWGGRIYGPYASAAEALRDGFHLPADPDAAASGDAKSGGDGSSAATSSLAAASPAPRAEDRPA